jgi:hypothetical protein
MKKGNKFIPLVVNHLSCPKSATRNCFGKIWSLFLSTKFILYLCLPRRGQCTPRSIDISLTSRVFSLSHNRRRLRRIFTELLMRICWQIISSPSTRVNIQVKKTACKGTDRGPTTRQMNSELCFVIILVFYIHRTQKPRGNHR